MENVKVSVIGLGHVGLVTAGALARWGHEVVGYDIDPSKMESLAAQRVPFFEPGLDELVREGVEAGRLAFTSDLREALVGAEVGFVCVGTPPLPGGGPNLSYVEKVGRAVAEHAASDLVLVEKSTVPANTGRRLEQTIEREKARTGNGARIDVVSNPEFLKEGSAVADTLHPDRIVYGTSSRHARDVMRQVYRHVVDEDACPVVETDVASAELIKHASNAFLATRISFMNAVAQISGRVGADVEEIARGMGFDSRIGPAFLRAGIGYGGSCFPKDVDAFAYLARQVGYEFKLLDHVREINEGQRDLVIQKLESELWHLDEKTITLLGAAFKPGTDDLREAPAIHLARRLLEEGATVRIYDPVALDGVAKELPEAERFDDPLEACRGAHAAVVATEWDEVRKLSASELLEALAYPIVIDGRNVFDPDEFIAAGLRYHSIGRRSVSF
jgi:UDPglucose 6-dehydrogenase